MPTQCTNRPDRAEQMDEEARHVRFMAVAERRKGIRGIVRCLENGLAHAALARRSSSTQHEAKHRLQYLQNLPS
eukprot:6186093-Pleurochrysis_carterae.AAC.4